MKKYNIALITNIPTPYRIPLFEKISKVPYINLCVYFTALSEKNRSWNTKLSDKFKYKVLPGITLKYHKKDLISYHINPSIFREILRNDYDIVIAGGYNSFATQISSILCKLKNIHFIIWSGSTINEPNLLRKISLPMTRFMFKHSDAFISYGTKAKDYLISIGVPSKEIFIAYNTVDIEFFKKRSLELKAKKNELKKSMGIQNEMIVIYVGQLIRRKNVKLLLDSYSKLKKELDVALLIVGDGPQENELKNICIENKIDDVFFVGFKQKDELPLYYAIADLFVLPSIQEVWGLVLNEAMACGLPVITTNKVGASIDLIKDGENGYIVRVGNINSLYLAMKNILIDSKVNEQMGNESEKIIEEGITINHAVNGFISAIKFVSNR